MGSRVDYEWIGEDFNKSSKSNKHSLKMGVFMVLSLAVILPLRIGSMAAATDSKILLRMKRTNGDGGE